MVAITKSPSKNAANHKTKNDRVPIPVSDISLRPRGGRRNLANTSSMLYYL